jgi:hypothetical protein
VNDTSHRAFFKPRILNLKKVAEVNARFPTGSRKFDHTHLLKGYLAAQAPEFVEGQTVTLKTDDLLVQWALVKMAAEQVEDEMAD